MENQPDPGSGGGSIWTSMPAIIGGIAAILTAIGTLVGTGVIGGSEEEPTKKTVSFNIRDPLGPDQISEDLNVRVDGRNVGTLSVDLDNRTDQISASVDEGEGKYDYTLSSVSIFRDRSGRPVELSGSGQGTINVKEGKTYEVYSHPVGNSVELSLAEP